MCCCVNICISQFYVDLLRLSLEYEFCDLQEDAAFIPEVVQTLIARLGSLGADGQ